MTEKDTLYTLALSLFEQALDYPSADRKAWIESQAKEDSALVARALEFLSMDSQVEAFLQTGGAVSTAIGDVKRPDYIGQYKIEDRVGIGGMGAVYRGRRSDGAFQHEVAIKIIRTGILSDKLIDRFSEERQILANFSHPNIAKLFDGGTLEDGTPYIVMELIDGVPIDKWCAQEGLETSSILTLFMNVCEAVNYAHQNLVVHRDITPSNVLVTKAGTAKLIDFGIAKLADGQVDASIAVDASINSLSFTPGFAAPERQSGAGINVLSDVYSLGKLLETLLARAQISKELYSVILKSTRNAPEDRYPSVAALMADISRYCDKRPVESHEGGALYRFKKLISRQKLSSALAAGVVLSVLGGGFIAAQQYQSAVKAQQVADQRFNQTRSLAKTLMFDLYDEVARVQGSLSARLKMVEAAELYLEGVSSQQLEERDLAVEVASGYARLGEIKGAPASGEKRDTPQSKAYLNKTITILEPLVQAHPMMVDAREVLGLAYYNLADIALYEDLDVEEALKALERSEKSLDASDIFSTNPATLQDRLMATMGLKAVAYGQLRQYDKSIPLLFETVEQRRLLSEQNPDDLELKRGIASTLNVIGMQQTYSGDDKAAIGSLSQAVDIMDELLEQNPKDRIYLRAQAINHWRRAFAYVGLENGGDALGDYTRAMSICEAILEQDPNNENVQTLLNTLRGEIMLAQILEKQFKAAETTGLQNVALKNRLAKDNPEDMRFRRNLMVSYFNMVDLFEASGEREKLCGYVNKIRNTSLEIAAKNALSPSDGSAVEELLDKNQICIE